MTDSRSTVRRRLAATASAVLVAASALVATTALQVASAPPAAALDNHLGRTPQMGWNSWNAYGCGIDENKIKAAADAIVSKDLQTAGYQYVNIDDCWQAATRGTDGALQADPVRFPSGIKALADYVHGKGLKLGIYTTPGSRSCANIYNGYPGQLGSLGHETQDANAFASWGVDYLKYDWCKADEDGVDAEQAFTAMGDALNATGRPIFYSIHREPQTPVDPWRPTVANSWRTTMDIHDNWNSMIGKAKANQPLAAFARPGAWNDPDMLEVGNGGMTTTEYRTHMSLWAEMAAPLLMGTDLTDPTKATTANLDILGNTDVIAVDQDPLGRQGTVVSRSSGLVVMTKALADGSRAVTLTNENTTAATISTTTDAIGAGGAATYQLKDLWSKAVTSTTGVISAAVAPHETVMYKVTPATRVAPPTGLHQLSELPWSSAAGGWGPVERNLSNGGQSAADGRTLAIGGTSYTKGLGTHAASDITYFLGGTCTSLTTTVGVDDEVGNRGKVTFQVLRDGVKIADSGTLTGTDAPKPLQADLTGGQEVTLRVTDGGDGLYYDHADWADAKISCPPSSGTHALSDLTWTSAPTNGYGPVERDTSNGGSGAGDGKPMKIGGTGYTKGLGTHANSDITYYLGGTCTSLTTTVGIDDEVGNNGSVVFQVLRDGVKIADSGILTGTDAPKALQADLTGGQEVTLHVTDNGDGNSNDHADWAQPVITCT
ncbi:NPCBM/NEW2 domain-containing protein [Kitasatospora sp. NBC_00240]|uniref:NPCBM/NEW2 domain-containing protein n=1 Tax=Kitasatospora sp. NBC_00240 TaxID=2903567 RepID=UPI00224D5675|nr:NPCBM/NEW2 domain-containing protein [Kitasatospora sp. NBC_00240]MCX5208459.1 NPCBM/NEW2 domain-containing protein [Kitasatospora sp. NBC_00240]